MNQKKGKIYLIPTLLGDTQLTDVLPDGIRGILAGIRHFAVEDLRSARRFLKKIDKQTDIDSLHFQLLNEHSKLEDISLLLQPLLKGNDLGVMSEAGTPCIADPGSLLVSMAHEKGIRIVPLTGPSSLILALMASGFNGQNFVFHGYLPVERRSRSAAIRQLENAAYRNDQTQIFIETPYRNMQMFDAIIESCSPETRLCIAANLTTDDEMIRTRQISGWKKKPPAIHKQPAVFLIYK
ncbi:MAG: SAM-dependent methyltransferase [Bacteroidetes bacterium]|nr:SAM-dependent methyltransferase [Bacteroidota bacterium]